MTGTPLAMASSTVAPNVSVRLGIRYASALAYVDQSSVLVMVPMKTASGILRASPTRAGPSPTTTMVKRTPRARSMASTAATSSRPFSHTMRHATSSTGAASSFSASAATVKGSDRAAAAARDALAESTSPPTPVADVSPTSATAPAVTPGMADGRLTSCWGAAFPLPVVPPMKVALSAPNAAAACLAAIAGASTSRRQRRASRRRGVNCDALTPRRHGSVLPSERPCCSRSTPTSGAGTYTCSQPL
mmetsp:Transcript_7988/g.24566  ORF Transcript_7988/g.24566 Transcript_7988/m.24566 type:complete len:247 (+) Transcript_7988:1372-2112(+)